MLMILDQWILRKSLNHLWQCHLGVQLDLCIFEIVVPTPNLKMAGVHQRRKMNRIALIPCFSDLLSFVSDFRQLPCRCLLEFFPFLVHSRFSIWYFHCLSHRNKFVHHIIVTQWIHPFPCNMVFMILLMRFIHALSCVLVGLDDACVFCLAFLFDAATGFPVQITLNFARRCSWHRNF